MANSKISALTSATTPLAGTETLPVVQSGSTKKVAVSDLTAGRTVAATKFGAGGIISPSYTFDADTASYGGSILRGTRGTSVLAAYQGSSSDGYLGMSSNNNLRLLVNDAAVVTLTTGSDVSINTGNLVIGTSGKGIDFSATPGTGTSELLNDYEEGTWTPVIIGSSTAGSGTYSLQEGFYTKIGRQVTVTGAIVWSAHTGTGTMRVSGLPYTIKNDNNYSSFALQYGTLTVSALAIAFIVTRPGQTYLQVDETVAGGSSQSGVPVDTAASLYFQATYFV